MSEQFFAKPILNSPYTYPGRHWELENGRPTTRIINSRRPADFVSPVPPPKREKKDASKQLGLTYGNEFVFEGQAYRSSEFIQSIRNQVDQWRQIPDPRKWGVTPHTQRLLQHWRHHKFQGVRPFFCQVEAVETAIWLTEVAAKQGDFWQHLTNANAEANPELLRLALKLATGAGKTTVMAMLIAWQTVNAVRSPTSKRFTRGFLIITPGITIKDRLRVLQPNDSESYYKNRELIPADMLEDIHKAKIVITNYHAFKLREKSDLSAGNRALLQGPGPKLNTLESEGEMIRRVMGGLMGLKNVLVLNDEAHHCYREKPNQNEVDALKGEDKEEAKKNNEAARLWISGIEMVKRQLGVNLVYDLSATPFFLRGSGYAEGTLFPWVVSDFSLMDAIECGIVKLPRVPVADNIPGGDMPKFRNLWEHIRTKMPKKGRGKGGSLDPLSLPPELQTALDALYTHYEKTFESWQAAQIAVPPVFIVVCNNTAASKLVYDFISGFYRETEDEQPGAFNQGRLPLFCNFNDDGTRLPKPRTLLIDSEQLESGEALDSNFREFASDEIERFRREIVERSGNFADGQNISDQDLLREVMNTVGKEGKLGEQIRCVVSVSMLTEGWDTNTVTHVVGIRAFGTQLLCEQVVGRALRRQSYELNEEGLFNVEYADVLGIPFDFTAQPAVNPQPNPPKKLVSVQAIRPERDPLEITFPRVEGYRVQLPNDQLKAVFTPDSRLELTPLLVGPTATLNQGIIGEGVNLTPELSREMRPASVVYHLTKYLLYNQYRDTNEEPKLHLFGRLKQITRQWLDEGYLRCTGDTYVGMLLYQELANMACEKIKAAITEGTVGQDGERPIQAILDAYNPTGSSAHVQFTTSKKERWQTDPRKCHLNWVVCDSDWEAEFCRVVEAHPQVVAYVKNQGLGLEVPYQYGSMARTYIPDFIVRINDGKPDYLNLVVEIKGFRGEDAKVKAETMRTYWVPGVNRLQSYGRWAFAEFTEVFEFETGFKNLVAEFTKP